VKEERNKYIQSYEAKWICWEFGGNILLRVFGREWRILWERKKRIYSVIYIVE
jgi:hypothetical protein